MKTKTLFSFLMIAILSVMIINVSSCSKEDNNQDEPDDNELGVSENTEVIRQSDWNNTIQSIDTSNYTFTFSDEIQNTNDIQEGDIIVSTIGNGYLRRVTNIRIEGEQVLLETEFVSLNEIVENGGFSFETVLTQNKIKRVEYFKKGVKIDTSHAKTPEEQDLNHNIFTYLDPANKVHLTGNFSMVPTIGMELDIQRFSLQYLDFNARVEEQLDLRAEIDLMDEENIHDVTLARIYYNAIIVQIDSLPVVITPTIDLHAGIEYEVNSTVTTEAMQQLNYNMGILYENSSWNTYSELTTSFSYAAPQLDASAHAKVYLKPELQLMFYGTVSPKFYNELYNNTYAEENATPWWEQYVGGEFGAGIEASILSNEIANEEFLFNDMSYENLIGDSESNFKMVSEDYQIIVDAVKEKYGEQYVDQYNTGEYYSGANAYYVNFDFQIDKRINYDPETFENLSTEEAKEIMIQRLVGAMQMLLQFKFPDAEPAQNKTEAQYVVTFESFNSDFSISIWEAEMKCVSSGNPPIFELVDDTFIRDGEEVIVSSGD